MSTYVDIEDIRPIIRDIVDEWGDWIDPFARIGKATGKKATCQYYYRDLDVHTELPAHCIAGEVLSRLGVSDDSLDTFSGSFEELVGNYPEFDNGCVRPNDDALQFSVDVIDAVSKIQRKQDQGYTWHDAVLEAAPHLLKEEDSE